MKLGMVGNGMIVQEILGFIDEIGFEEIRICGRKTSEEKLNALAEKYHLSTVYTDYDDLLKSDVDVVYIGILNDLHFEYAKRALEAGKHVICEKPITINISQLEELDILAAEKNVFLFEAMSIYHMPAYKQLQQDVKLIGDIKICNFNYSQMSSRYKTFKEGKALPGVFDPKHYGGALRDLNIYNISAMVGLFGMPKNVTYSANIEKDIDTSGILIADYDSFKCICTGAKDCATPGPSTIQGVNGTVCIYPHVNGMTEYDVLFNDKETDTKEVYMSDGSHRLYFEFVEFKRIIEEQDVEAAKQLMQYSKWAIQVIDEATK